MSITERRILSHRLAVCSRQQACCEDADDGWQSGRRRFVSRGLGNVGMQTTEGVVKVSVKAKRCF